jgi:hypothetical protein
VVEEKKKEKKTPIGNLCRKFHTLRAVDRKKTLPSPTTACVFFFTFVNTHVRVGFTMRVGDHNESLV